MTKPGAEDLNPATAFADAAKRAVAIARKHKLLPKELLSAPVQFAKEACKDNAVATVEFTRNGFRFVVGERLRKTRDHKLFRSDEFDEKKGWDLGEEGLLIMVLESPHQDEFDEDLKPKGPAQGTTGENIGRYLERQHRHLPHLATVARDRYRLVLMNAVEYQCSLGVSPTAVFRDFVFREVWERGGRYNFVMRLKKYLAGVKNHLMIVCCSKGETILPIEDGADVKELRDLVYDAAREVVSEERLFRRPHPSSGWFCRKSASSSAKVRKNSRRAISTKTVRFQRVPNKTVIASRRQRAQ